MQDFSCVCACGEEWMDFLAVSHPPAWKEAAVCLCVCTYGEEWIDFLAVGHPPAWRETAVCLWIDLLLYISVNSKRSNSCIPLRELFHDNL